MQYGIIRLEKVKRGEVDSLQRTNDRFSGKYCNPNIDPRRQKLNVEFVQHGRYTDEVSKRIAESRQSTRAVRKDAVVLVEGLATASPEFFDNKVFDETMQYFNDVFEFCKSEFGEQNLVHFTVHMDETTPHAHFGFVPLKEGSLSWKKFFPARYALGMLQDHFYEEVGKPWGLERGEKDTGRTHKDVAQMRRDSEREIKELERQKISLQREIEKLETDLAVLREETENDLHEANSES